MFANSGVVTSGGRAFCPSGPGPAASLRYTGAVRRALELARTPIAQSGLQSRQAAARREQALRDLALDAQAEHRHVVDLDDALPDALQAWTPARS